MQLKEYQERTLTRLALFLDQAQHAGVAAAFAATAEPDPEGQVPSYRPIVGEDRAVIAELAEVPYVALRIPTGGGKTVLGAHIIRTVAQAYLQRERPMVVWLVPSTTIKTQTIAAFQDARHPYRRELDATFGVGRVQIFDLSDIDHLRPQDLDQSLCVFIGTFQTARVNDTGIRDIYADKEALEPHFIRGALPEGLEKTDDQSRVKFSFANLVRLHRPLIITDEAHNATTGLAYKVYQRLAPSAIVELTATPDLSASNVLVRVSASELKAEDMIKLPVELRVHADGWQNCITAALQRRAHLETLCPGEHPDYIRPILLIQAENRDLEATVDVVRQHLIDNEQIPAEQIKRATGDQRELEGLDLFDPTVPVRVIITNQALREGWDCSFAYVLCSLSSQRSGTAIEQLLGRVLRMPYARKRQHPALNRAYSHVMSPHFSSAAQELTDELQRMGFNPLEALEAVQGQLPVTTPGDATAPLFPQRMELTLPSAPNFAALPPETAANIAVTELPDGKFQVAITGAVEEEAIGAIVQVLPRAQQPMARASLVKHNYMQAAQRTTPASAGVAFAVPQMALRLDDGTVIAASTDALLERGEWSLNDHTPALHIQYEESSRSFLIDVDGGEVAWEPLEQPVDAFTRTLAGNWSDAVLAEWVARQIRRPDVIHAELVAWVRRGVQHLLNNGLTLDQLARAKFLLVRQMGAEVERVRQASVGAVFQRSLLDADAPVAVDFDHTIRFDPLAYPKRWDCPANYRWKKHYYTLPGDLPHKRKDGKLAEEFLCAVALDSHPNVQTWVRNVVHETQFWLPTPTGRTYPDFVALLDDGRVLVVEYKGGDRVSNADSQMKAAIGTAWARASGGRCLYLMATAPAEAGGWSIDAQIQRAIAG